MRSDSNIWKDSLNTTLRNFVKKIFVSHWVADAKFIAVTGSYNREYWLKYGMKKEQEQWWPIWIDYSHFRKARKIRKQPQNLRVHLGFTSQINLLYVGRLIPRKGLRNLCQALLQLDKRIGLTIVGRGEEEASLKHEYSPRLSNRLWFSGAVSPDELPRYYAAADVFVLPCGNQEPWGLVINEAMAAGLPIICGNKIGAAGDLVVNGKNGILTKNNEVNDWIQAIKTMTNNPDNLKKMGRTSEQIIDQWEADSRPDDCIRKLLRNYCNKTVKNYNILP